MPLVITAVSVNVIRVDAKLVGHNLAEDGVVALAVAVCPGEHGHRAGGVHPNRAAFPEAGHAAQCPHYR